MGTLGGGRKKRILLCGNTKKENGTFWFKIICGDVAVQNWKKLSETSDGDKGIIICDMGWFLPKF